MYHVSAQSKREDDDYCMYKIVKKDKSNFWKRKSWSKSISAIQYTTTEISHVLQGLDATTYYSVSVLAVLKDTGVTDVSEIEFKTGKLIYNFIFVVNINSISSSTSANIWCCSRPGATGCNGQAELYLESRKRKKYVLHKYVATTWQLPQTT